MKIAIDCRAIENKNWAGKEQVLVFVIRNIVNYDNENEYILYFRSFSQDRLRLPKGYKTKIFKLPTPIWQVRVLIDLVLEKVDLIFCPCSYLLPAINFFKPTVLLVPDIVSFLPVTRKGHKKSVIFKEKLTLALALRFSRRIIAISNSTKNDIVSFFNTKEEKINVVHLAVREEFRVMERKEKIRAILNKYNIPNKFFLFISTIEPRKNIIRIIEAYNYLIEKKIISDYSLVIIGKKGWYYEHIFEKVKELKLENRIMFIGYVPDRELPSFYNSAFCFVYPSIYEGFGLPVLEAMSCACPVISTNTSSLPEIVEDAGILVNPYNFEDIANGMESLLCDEALRQSYIEKGLKQVKKFTQEKTIKKLINVFNSIKIK